jgi:hypothetical protein
MVVKRELSSRLTSQFAGGNQCSRTLAPAVVKLDVRQRLMAT